MTTSPDHEPRPRRLGLADLADPVQFLALGFGSGLAPVAPGTFGSLVGLAIAWAVAIPGPVFAVAATLLVTIAGVWICGEAARRLGVHDHPAIVWDEIAGMMITMLAAPPQWWGGLLGFLLFRLFDIAKPWPIREIDHGIGGGTGIMLDDVVAGVLAALVLMLVRTLT
jgi:phosphatidylglycerophosphatase A